jgi:hypothetical protein
MVQPEKLAGDCLSPQGALTKAESEGKKAMSLRMKLPRLRLAVRERCLLLALARIGSSGDAVFEADRRILS